MPGLAPAGGRKPKPGGLGPGNPPRPPRFGGKPMLGSGGPNPRGLCKFGCLVSGSGVLLLLLKPFSLCSDTFLSSSYGIQKLHFYSNVKMFFLVVGQLQFFG